MGLFRKNAGRSRDAPETREVPKKLEDFIKSVDLDADGMVAGAGVSVSEESAMRTSAVYACVKILAETVASLPLHLYKKDGKNKVRAEEHPLFSCLYEMPNGETTSFNFREVMMTALLLWGNGYARIIKDKSGKTKELWYLRPDLMTVGRENGKIKYEYSDESGGIVKYSSSQIFHVKGLSFDGVKGLSPIGQMKEAVGLSLATEQYGSAFFGNGARPGGVIEHPGTLKDPEKLRESWNKVFQGSKNSNKTAVLEAGAKFHTIGLPPEESQFLETRKFQINEICRIFRVPPHLVGDLEKATFSNIEHQSIEFVQHTIRPWLVRWEQEINRSLLSDIERTIYFARFNVDGLLRGDYASRMNGYATARQNGWMSANDIRELEDMNPIEGGDAYLVNGNMVQPSDDDKGTNKNIPAGVDSQGGNGGKTKGI